MPPTYSSQSSSHTRAKKVLLGLIGVAVLLLVLLIFVLMRSPQSAPVVTEQEFLIRPDMSAFIALAFDWENEGTYYDWALVEGDDSEDQLVETSSFELYGQSYEYLLATVKARPTDEDYTVVDYLALTILVQNGGAVDTIVYIDLGADGDLDSVYENDVLLDDPALAPVAQNRYTTEIALSRDYLIGALPTE